MKQTILLLLLITAGTCHGALRDTTTKELTMENLFAQRNLRRRATILNNMHTHPDTVEPSKVKMAFYAFQMAEYHAEKSHMALVRHKRTMYNPDNRKQKQ